MLKTHSWGIISVIVIVSLTIVPQLSLGQIPTLDKLNLENSQSTQCLDFNQDKICEYIVLANGTMVKNPNLVSTAAPAPTTVDLGQNPNGTCMGLSNSPGYCEYVKLANGQVIPNLEWTPGKYTQPTTSGFVTTIAEPTQSNNDENEDAGDEEAAEESGDEGADDLPQEGGCQEDDDYCDADEGCRSDEVDCIDDREFDEDDYNG